jgi:hypothetical protein
MRQGRASQDFNHVNGELCQPGHRRASVPRAGREALGMAPPVVLRATHEKALEYASLAQFKRHALNLI